MSREVVPPLEEPGRLRGLCLDNQHRWWVLPLPSMSDRKLEECSKCWIDRYEEWLAELEAMADG